MDDLFQFLSLSDPNVRYAVLGVLFLGIGTAVVGTFAFLQKKSLVGDAVAHAVLPGICLAFLIIRYKHPFVLLFGAFISGWLSIYAMDFLIRKTRLKADTVIATVLSVFFGVGILLLSIIQSSGNASQSGLNHFLFGQAASIISTDVYILGIVCLILVLLTGLFFRPFTLISFDKDYAQSLGISVRFYEGLLSAMTVMAIAVGIRAVGVVLMAAMLITPATGARYWTNHLVKMIFIAAGIGILAGLIGSYISTVAPKMPTGPWIVIALTFLTLLSILFAPERGVFYKFLKKRKKALDTLEENILKLFYQLGEQDNDFFMPRKSEELNKRRKIRKGDLYKGLHRLTRKKKLDRVGKGSWKLTDSGWETGQRVTRLHRLWEIYMSKYLKLPADHLHAEAENLEHLISPEMEAFLLRDLDFPEKDPHNSPIPYPEKREK